MRSSITRSERESPDLEQRDQQQTDVGRSTRSQDLGFAAMPAMFDDEPPAWEAIDPGEYETEEVEHENTEAISALEAPDADQLGDDDVETSGRSADPGKEDEADEEEAPAALARPSDAVEVGSARAAEADHDHDDDADDDDDDDAPVAHAAGAAKKKHRSDHGHDRPFERKVKRATGHDAKQDKLNKGAVHGNRIGKVRGKNGKLRKNPDQIGRPGLRVKGRDEFHLRGEFAYRYQIVNGSKAVACDKIWEKELQHGFDKEGQRLALNPSAPRRLFIDGVGVWCVMSWAGAQSAAWIAIKDLKGDFHAIKNKASSVSKRWNPKDAGRKKRDHATEMKFRLVTDDIAKADEAVDPHRYIVPGQKSKNGNEVGDYLTKKVLRRHRETGTASTESARLERQRKTPGEAGKAFAIEDNMRQLVSITGNLPHDKTPPIAIDVARPGVDSFFVPKGPSFRREISMYKLKAKKSRLRQTWVYGYVGRDEGNRKVADKNRRGWVPLRTLVKP